MSAVNIIFGPNAQRESVAPYAIGVIESILQAAGLGSALITSTARTPRDQARAMYNNIVRTGVAAQKRLYAAAGDEVIDAYSAAKQVGKSARDIQAAMERKIIAIGPAKVSLHCADPAKLCVVDIAPSSIANKRAFESAVKADKRVSRLLMPPVDPAYHLEIPIP